MYKKIENQVRKLYFAAILRCLSLTGAWAAILSARGYTLVEIGIAETVFHAVSLLCELPSGILADVFGRKRLLVAGSMMRLITNVIMIYASSLWGICAAMVFWALSYNCASGSDDALAYDSMKAAGRESAYERYNANQMLLYRICDGISTMCAGVALYIGYQRAYGIDVVVCLLQLIVLLSLYDVSVSDKKSRNLRLVLKELTGCAAESLAFLKSAKRVALLMFCNSFVGAADILLLFYLQAKLLEKGLSGWELGFALFFMQMGGVAGTRVILRMEALSYRKVFAVTGALVAAGILVEHMSFVPVVVCGGFLAALGDDALQVRTNRLLQEMFPSEQRATLLSVESFTFSVVMIVLTPLAGILFTWW